MRRHRVFKDEDAPWIIALAKSRYPPAFDVDAAELWVRNIVIKQPVVFLPIRTDHAFLIALISILPWMPGEPEASVVMVCAEDGHMYDAIHLLRVSVDWARGRHAATWQLNSITDYDLGPIATRLGASFLTPRYTIRLRE